VTERTLSREEVDAYVDAPMSDEERAEILDLRRWFTARYPTVAARMAYVRRRRGRPLGRRVAARE
jgi:hypothetical protein